MKQRYIVIQSWKKLLLKLSHLKISLGKLCMHKLYTSLRSFSSLIPFLLYFYPCSSLIFIAFTEEWITKKKVELTTKKQIETRVKRQVVLEDGKIVEDSGPIVTTNTTEDTEKQEHQQTEVIWEH